MAKRKLTLHTRDWDGTFQLMKWWKSDVVRQAKVMVVGAGALGNEVLKNLALMNIGHILIVDFDTVEYTNLCRSVLFRSSDVKENRFKADVAAKRIREINPQVKVMTLHGDIGIDVGVGIFKRMDAIIGCLDNRLARLYINKLSFKAGKPWIDGAIENLAGQLNVYRPGVACYECELGESEWRNIRAKMGCPDIARRYSSQGRIPTTPISSSIIGAMQVQEALKIIHGNERHSMAGESFYYEGMTNTVIQSKSRALQEDCGSHFAYDPQELIVAQELSCNSTIGDTLEWLKKYFKEENPVIELDHDLVLEVMTDKHEVSHELIVAKPHLSDEMTRALLQKGDESVRISNWIQQLTVDFPKPELTLKQVGIPPLHHLSVWANENSYLVELAADESHLQFT